MLNPISTTNPPVYRPTFDPKTGKTIHVASDDPTDTVCISDANGLENKAAELQEKILTAIVNGDFKSLGSLLIKMLRINTVMGLSKPSKK